MKQILISLTISLFLVGISTSVFAVTPQTISEKGQVETYQTNLNVNNLIKPGDFEQIENILGSGSRSGTTLWNQYDTDGSNGYSHGQQSVFAGYSRDLLDDFEVPAGQTWTFSGFKSLNLWDNVVPGSGTDFL